MPQKMPLYAMSTIVFSILCGGSKYEANLLQDKAALAQGPKQSSINSLVTDDHETKTRHIRLKKGQSVEVDSDKIITLQIIEDSRCPVNEDGTRTSCFWEGDVYAHFTLFSKDELSTSFFVLRLHNGSSTVVSAENLVFSIVAVDPYPVVDNEQEKEVILSVSPRPQPALRDRANTP